MKQIKTILKEVENEFDLKKRFPNYFNPIIFRTATIIMFTLFLIAYASNDYKLNNVYAECQSDKECFNPFYLCSNIQTNNSNPYVEKQQPCLQTITWKTKDICSQGYCNQEKMQPHEVIGNKPNFFNQNFTLWILLLYITTITINHILYKRKQK